MKSLVCKEYASRIGNEVGWGNTIFHIKVNEINSMVNVEYRQQIMQLNFQATQAAYKMQLSYLG